MYHSIMAAVDRINLRSDPRIEHRNANLNGFSYHYLYGEPKNYKATILMVSLVEPEEVVY